MRTKIHRILPLVSLLLILSGVVPAEASQKTFHLESGESALLAYHGIKRIAVGNPEVVDVRPLDSREVLVTAKTAGNSTIMIWDRNGRHYARILIHPSHAAKKWEVEKLLREEGVQVALTDSAIVLEGTVATPAARKRALAIAEAYSAKVVNLLNVAEARQIRLEASVVELEKGATERLGLQNMNSSEGGVMTGFIDLAADKDHFGILLQDGDFHLDEFSSVLNALEKKNVARILSKPYLTTLSGETSHLNVGGEIPVPVGVDNGEIKIEWKPYGVMLSITPELDGENGIWLSLEAEVSEIDWENRIVTSGIEIPALKTRKISNRVRVRPGQPLVVGGLIDNKQSELKTRIPILSDIPLIGELFKSKRFENSETELVITVVPEVVISR